MSTLDAVILQAALSDEEVVSRVIRGETGLFEILMRRYNHRLYRAVRAEGNSMNGNASVAPNPEQEASGSEMRRLLEEAVERLPEDYRTVFMLRDVEERSTDGAAEALDIGEENVRVRLQRARWLLRKILYARAGMGRKEAFAFHSVRCDRVVENAFERIRLASNEEGLLAWMQ